MTDDSGIIKNAGEAPLPDKYFRQYDRPTIFQRECKRGWQQGEIRSSVTNDIQQTPRKVLQNCRILLLLHQGKPGTIGE
jgi:hypothetical protein